MVIPTIQGREESLERCIKAYLDTAENELRVTVIHDRPTCGIAWNDGAARADEVPWGDFLHLSADDLEPLPGWDAAAIKAIRDGNQPCPRLMQPAGGAWYYGLQQVEPPEGTRVEFSTIPFLPWKLWPEVGPSLDCHYYTDNWLSLKAEQAGLPSAYYPGYGFVHHHEMVGRGAGMEQNQRMMHDRAVYERAVSGL